MISFQIDLEPGFRKADINSIPGLSNEAIFKYASKKPSTGKTDSQDLKVDFISVKKTADICEVHCMVFPANASAMLDAYVRVTLKVNVPKNEILDSSCEKCSKNDSCAHILALVFWLHRKTSETDTPAIRDFWGTETEYLIEEERTEVSRLRDIFPCDEMRVDADMEASAVNDGDAQLCLETVLDEMEILGLKDFALYRQCRPSTDEFESVFIHHTLLDANKNGVKDTRSFVQYMEDQAKKGIFDGLSEISKHSYKTPLWLEAQYMRLRCSLMHNIASRKDPQEDEQILESLFCKDRELNVEERQQLKQHKRFILKQTEKLENKTYNECGLLLSESYPYISASPDGITDDHIVEIKAPKTDEEFEKYLEGRETIAPKYMAQIQIQMYMANVTKALYCVLSPTFDTNGALHYVWVQADMEFVASLLGAAEDFWKDVVFPRLAKIYLGAQ